MEGGSLMTKSTLVTTASVALLLALPYAAYADRHVDSERTTEPEQAETAKSPAMQRTEKRPTIQDAPIRPYRQQRQDCSATETVTFEPIDVYPLLPVHGDTELAGYPELEINAKVTHTHGRIILSGEVKIDEKEHHGVQPWTASDDTRFVGHFQVFAIAHKPGCVISVASPLRGHVEAQP